MENKYLLTMLVIIAIAALSVGIVSARGSGQGMPTMSDDNFGAGDMTNMMQSMMGDGFGMGGMMSSGMMQGNFVHDEDDIKWMRKEMKEHMNFTDEEFDDMAKHCPMMRGR